MTTYYLELNKRKNAFGEFVIRCYEQYSENGRIKTRRIEEGCYYTDDWNDAVNTLNFEARRHHTHVRVQDEWSPRKPRWTLKCLWITYDVE